MRLSCRAHVPRDFASPSTYAAVALRGVVQKRRKAAGLKEGPLSQRLRRGDRASGRCVEKTPGFKKMVHGCRRWELNSTPLERFDGLYTICRSR